MIVTKNNLLVKEIKFDIKTSDGLIQKYDDCSDFIFTEIIEIGKDIQNKVEYQDKNNILVLNRINKRPYLDGQYFINENDILAIITTDELNKIKA